MNYLDWILIAILVIGAVQGYQKGLLVEVLSFIAFFLGLFLAVELAIPVSELFFKKSDYFQLWTIGVFAAIFIAVIVIVSLLSKLLKKVIDLTIMGVLDNALGALAGIFKWAFILSVLFWVFDSIGLRLPSRTTEASALFPYIAQIGPAIFEWLANMLPFIQKMIDSLKKLEDESAPVYTFLSFNS